MYNKIAHTEYLLSDTFSDVGKSRIIEGHARNREFNYNK